jgi:hypothetical protein
MVTLFINEELLGTAYGTMQSIQNLGLALANILIGYTIDEKGYFTALNIFILFLTSSLSLETKKNRLRLS